MALSKGEKWVSLLRAYGPTSENHGQQAEHVDRLAARLGVPKLAFIHPAAHILAECFPRETGAFRNVLLTGTAGDGKTSLCLDLVQRMTGDAAQATAGVQTFAVDTGTGPKRMTFIYDVTAWKKKTNGYLSDQHVEVLHAMAQSSYGQASDFFILAVNDGQMHELFRALPSTAPPSVRRLEADLIEHHARKEGDCGPRLKLINLSLIRSEAIMRLCLEAVLDRPEWSCFEEEPANALFHPSSSLSRNYRALKSPEIRNKLLTLARVADAADHHLPVRGTLCLLSNALLGHPDAREKLIRPGDEASSLLEAGRSHRAALHKTLFGYNLSPSNRQKREVYRFLSMLRIGAETTNDLDELLIFGSRDDALKESHEALVARDPFEQRDPHFEALLRRYIRGDIGTEEETGEFLTNLAAERRRIFLQATPEQMGKHDLWRTAVFYSAREYLDEILEPLTEGRSPTRLRLRKLATGLNRAWVGLLLGENASEIHIATGLDLTTSPVCDLHLTQLDLESDPPGLKIVPNDVSGIPDAVLCAGQHEFRFALTLPRFEFLSRVADGAMPSSFSRESSADFMTLKQQCLRDLKVRASSRTLQLIEVLGAGKVQKLSIHLGEP
jgi:hypothetical protein